MSLPSGYKRLEYIQSSGTQYIDTGFKPNQDTRVVTKFDMTQTDTAWRKLWGSGSGSYNRDFALWNFGTTKFQSYYGTKDNTAVPITDMSLNVDANKNIWKYSGETITFYKNNFTCAYSMYIFNVNKDDNPAYLLGMMKLYLFKIYDNDVLVRDFIPCKNPSGVIGLWDDVNSVFYQNAGSGTFISGPEVKGTNKTLIDGTGYDVNAGKCLVSGTAYTLKKGRTLIGGTAFTIPFAKGIPLSTITPGAILYLNESGSPVPFCIAKHDYESGLNGAGRTLIVRKDCYDNRAFSNRNNAYAGNSLDSGLCNTYLKLLDADIQAAIGTTKFYYTPGNGNTTVTTLQRAVFQLSVTELGKTASYANTEGTALEIASSLQIAYMNGSAVSQWTRSPFIGNTYDACCLITYGNVTSNDCTYTLGSRPAFTLPGSLGLAQNPDGTYSQPA